MAERPIGKAIGAKKARKLLREVGGAPDAELLAELERVLGYEPSYEIHRLTDGRVVDISYGSGRIFESAEAYRRLLALVEERGRRKPQHPLGTAFPNGHGFIEAVPRLAQELPSKLRVKPQALNGSVDSLEYIDKAARRLGGQNCLDDPTILGPIIAYVGEAMREATAGRWEIRSWDSHGEEDCDRWEPVVVGANGREHHPFGIFKDLLERGSVWARVEFDLGGPRTAPREEV